jgi:tetratricopeptide (TPR) repeat protein
MSDEATLNDLMSLWEQEQARGHDLAPADLCRGRPELTPELERRIHAVRQMKALASPDPVPCPAADPWATRPAGASVAAAGDAPATLAPVGGTPSEAPASRSVPFPSPPGYEILGELGRGGMGVVYQAVHRVLKRKLALKMILVGNAASPRQIERFRVEAEAAARLQHANIVPIYDVGEWQGRPFFSLELMDGGTLAEWLARGTPEPGEAALLIAVMARAMYYAHQRGVVHRDLKPANVLLGLRDGRRPGGTARPALAELVVKVSDFGLAKLLVEGDAGQTETGSVLGTPCYMAPEQAAGRTREVGPASDIYALGAILYECLTGRPPFLGPTPLETARQAIHEEPAPPSRLRPKLPRDLETICLKCLRKDPGQRYLSARELAEDLERFCEGRPIRARPVPPWERLGKWVRRRPAGAALVAVSGLALAGLVAMTLGHYASLRAAVAAARGEERSARKAEAGAREALAQELFTAAQAAAAREDWAEAKAQLFKAQGQLGPEALAGSLRGRVDDLLDVAQRHLDEQDARQAARQRYERFRALRDEALIHNTPRPGADDPADELKITRRAAEEALRLIGISPEGKLPAGAPYGEDEAEAIATDCYELLLILAEVAALPAPGQGAEQRRLRAQDAIGLLDRAKGVRRPTWAYFQRRARYREQLGDAAGAADERLLGREVPPDTALDQFLAGEGDYKQVVLGGEADPARRLAEAAAHFENSLRLQPDHFWSRYYLALCRTQLGLPHEAMDALNGCLAARPDFVWLYLMRGVVLGQLGSYDAAEGDFRKAQELEAKERDESARYALYANRGIVRFRAGKVGEAIDDFRRAVELSPARTPAHLSLATVYQSQRKWDEALDEVKGVIQADPSWADPYRYRARVLARRGDREAALGAYAEALRAPKFGTREDQAGDHFERARLLLGLGRYREVVAACDAALAAYPGFPSEVHQLRARALLLIADGEADPAKAVSAYKGAARALDRYLETGAPTRDIYEARGLAREKSGDRRGALSDYTRALDLAPKDAALYVARGWLYLLKDAPRLAHDDFDMAVGLAPNDGSARAGRGYSNVVVGEYKAAVDDADEAARRSPDKAVVLYTAARTFAQAAGRADADRALTVPQAQEAHSLYEGRALELIRAALRATDRPEAFWAKHVAGDLALAPISRGDGFVRLSMRYSGGGQ